MPYQIAKKNMRVPPSGSPSTIPKDPRSITAQLDEGQRFVVETLASTARTAGRWMGICIRDVYITEELKKTPLARAKLIELGLFHANFDPSGWLAASLHAQRDVALTFKSAASGDEPLVTIIDGYAFPTQYLADLVCV